MPIGTIKIRRPTLVNLDELTAKILAQVLADDTLQIRLVGRRHAELLAVSQRTRLIGSPLKVATRAGLNANKQG